MNIKGGLAMMAFSNSSGGELYANPPPETIIGELYTLIYSVSWEGLI